ncbi:trypsin-like peptidase domain-containing protein [Vibrio parahaemolyticus]|uniref:trypsin-like peptidase domain-containing protein n=1 Tax=Vibrio parahaemolyticus TaxID=670 RepID=UPI0003FD938C|nr:trypsin-like peptidase domain-containing protein [Vibrio parahaemolyticus]TOG32894.1 serine protease [Vibrio parahaemolyticus]HCG8759872.1 trypsin-like peptidase domain-containing protein [Vibrio parahaemolyticus]
MTTIAQPSVQSLIIEMRFNGQTLSTGTAFVVNGRTGPLLITNRHNVTGRHQETDQPLSKTGGIPNEIVVVHNSKRALGEWVGIVEPILDADDNPLWIEHPVLGKKADFVALPLTNLQGVELYAYDLNNTGPDIHIGPADSVSVVGFPFGIQAGGSLAVWATGFMASEPEVNFKDLPTFLIDCRSRQGQSGSAVIAYRSGGSVAMKDGNTAIFAGPVTKFLGVYSGRINSESDLGIVWKASAIKELVDSI